MLLPIQIKSKPRIKLNHNTKKIIHHFSGRVSKDVLYWSTVLTMCKHWVGWLYQPFLYVWGKVGDLCRSVLLGHGHLVVTLDCVWWLKFLRGLSLAMQSHSYLRWGPFSTMLFHTHNGHIAMETLINSSVWMDTVHVFWLLWSRNLLHSLPPPWCKMDK